ncbi:hypothetical protein [Leifsonia sp. Leaf264]|uniref:hypothetical protein n=1 Tax=Leifsonia sp. Leaf264 TaxID=1736314 RepID=UPI000A43D2FC|nr:hypothetical protein [Leifsonia sp. Leaf264]
MLLHDPGADVLGADVTHIIRALRQRSEPTLTAVVATAAGVSAPRTRAALKELVSIGVMTLTKVGRANAYTINRTHVAWDGIQLLLDARLLVLRQARRVCEQVAPAGVSIALCAPSGALRGAWERSARFIVVVPESTELRADVIEGVTRVLRDTVGSMTGNTVAVTFIAEDDLRERVRNGDKVAKEEWFRSATVHGPDLSQIILEMTRQTARPTDNPVRT